MIAEKLLTILLHHIDGLLGWLEVFVYPKAYLWLEQNRTYSGGIVCKAQLRLKPYGETLADVGFDTCGRPRLKIVGLSLRSIARSH